MNIPKKVFLLTDEEADRIIELLDICRHPDSAYLIDCLYSQQHRNPSDKPYDKKTV